MKLSRKAQKKSKAKSLCRMGTRLEWAVSLSAMLALFSIMKALSQNLPPKELERNDTPSIITDQQHNQKAYEKSQKGEFSSVSNHEDLDEYGYMGACLYVNDENHRLVEWIPYHYYVAGVRRIIIINTPNSTSTPRPILDRWKDRINITLLNEHGATDIPGNNSWSLKHHRRRQRRFLTKCHQTIKKEGWKWSFHLDPDEYFVVNHLVRKPGSKLYRLKIPSEDLVIPSQKEASSIPKLLTRVEPFRNNTDNPFLHTRPCLQYARKQFSNKQDRSSISNVLELYANVSKGIDTGKMNTFRWMWGGVPEMIIGKGIAELSGLRYDDFKQFSNVHYPVSNVSLCMKNGVWVPEEESPLLIHHYPASWSEMMARNNTQMELKNAHKVSDAQKRNMTALLEYRYKVESETDGKIVQGNIQDWLPGFIDFVGKGAAERLLQHVGNAEMAKLGAHITWGDN